MTARIFLTAEWRYLAMVNFAVDPGLLAPHVPAGTELDRWNGHHLVSVVGFRFRDTRVLGFAIPCYRHFEEVNLRFYVRREVAGELRRAVVFIREIVPRRAIAVVARKLYNEPYVALPMRHEVLHDDHADAPRVVSYAWNQKGAWNEVRVQPLGSAEPLRAGSEEEFVTEHYWGYTRQRDGSTIEYQVEHPRWRVWRVRDAQVTGEMSSLYGAELARVVRGEPISAFLADGSAVTVRAPRRLDSPSTTSSR